jgi:hypothetical protein
MSFWEAFAIICTAAGLFASILGAWLTYAARKNGEATRGLIGRMETNLRESAERTHRETLEVLNRMDQRADERHREVIAAIQALGRA